MPKLVVMNAHADTYRRELQRLSLPGLEAHFCSSVEEATSHVGQVELLFGAPDLVAALLPDCPQLRWVQSSWAGVRPLLDASRRDYVLTGVKGIFGQSMSEYVLGWLLALNRGILRRSQARQWDDTPEPSVRGRHLGVLGTGSIGAAVAGHCASLGFHVTGLNRRGSQVEPFEHCFPLQQRLAFAQGLDALLSLMPDTAESTAIVDADVLAALNPGAVLINAGRANALVMEDVLAALESGQLSAVVLDVLDEEPLPDSSPLWRVPGLYITSHTAAPTHPAEIVQVFADNYRRYVAGEPLQHVIDFDRGY